MKIICIGQNYLEHIKELNSAIPEEPVFFLKPDTALLLDNKPFYLPDFSNDIHHEVEIVLKINRVGKNIAEQFAHKYYEELTVGIDFTARDIQQVQKTKGLPWEKAKAFDFSATVGRFVTKKSLSPALPEGKGVALKNPSLRTTIGCDRRSFRIDSNNLNFHLDINGKTVQKGNTSDLLFSFDKIIAFISQFITLKIGDLIYTGTPVGIGAVKIGDKLEAYMEGEKLLGFEVK
ncbi:MAG: fumarylacetoacetate hydrolase family protein [Bacteroidetes bacterium]|nr:fumarylacetoacetate hydrolase family protein [Bacteroidota bacterium]